MSWHGAVVEKGFCAGQSTLQFGKRSVCEGGRYPSGLSVLAYNRGTANSAYSPSLEAACTHSGLGRVDKFFPGTQERPPSFSARNWPFDIGPGCTDGDCSLSSAAVPEQAVCPLKSQAYEAYPFLAQFPRSLRIETSVSLQLRGSSAHRESRNEVIPLVGRQEQHHSPT